ncbi:MAG TPA: glycoside hydrolase family 15 protein [Thermomicrobiales bacterium]|nr:glycoside hydrolase family 15 protein [Thermomicrobiales bacterium]
MISTRTTERYPPIGDYAIIGNCRSAALVSREGSMDWLCWPRFDSPSIFAALLDAEQGGCFSIRPTGAFRTERRYLPDTNVIETVFHTAHGSLALRDVMVVMAEGDKHNALGAEHEILRELEGLTGEVEVELHYEPRPDYARRAVSLESRDQLGVWCHAGAAALVLRGDVSLAIAADKRSANSTIGMRAGERRYLSLSYSSDGPAVIPALGSVADARFAQSIQWWQSWANRCTYDGPYREAVVRSLLALKLMSFAPSGAVIAAPTTSLPEKIGGQRNWDYRYCWLRDASFTVRALLELGYQDEAGAFCGWLLHATSLTWPELQVVYDVFGKARLPEDELDHFEGYAGSRPVRIGNGAHDQIQMDVYGEVLDAISRLANRPDFFDSDTLRFLNGLGRTVCDQWREPDAGIWEGRGEPQHYTHSKVLCWIALDRLIKLHETHGVDIDVDRFVVEREAIRAEVERRGYNEQLGAYTQVFDGDALDASLLTLPWYGYIDGTHPRMLATLERIRERLGHAALIYRYADDTDDGFPSGEGAFGVCGFWAVDCQVRCGHIAEATEAFEQLIGYANDVGLYAEETDPGTGAALGNFPQAFTHLGLINAALTLAGDGRTPGAIGGAERQVSGKADTR